MRRRTKALLITVAMILWLTGCGKKESAVISESKTNNSNLSMEEDVLDETPEEQIVTFECMNEIKEASPESGLIQIYDMLFQYGCKVSEAIEIIENSQNKFEYYHDYNENELILPGDYSEQIILIKDNDWYFQFQGKNLSDETIPLKDCTVTWIKTERASKGNVFYAGSFDENSEAVMYDYIKKVMNNYEIIMETTEYDSDQNKQINILYFVPSEIVPEGHFRINFVFEVTGELKTFKISLS